MSMPYLNLKKLEIETFRFHSIKAFCPETRVLLKLRERCANGTTSLPENFWIHMLHERLEREKGVWKPSPGFMPTFTVGNSAASAVCVTNDHHWMIARLLRQGIGILTQAEETTYENQLVEKNPQRERVNNTNENNVLDKLANGINIPSSDNWIMESQGASPKHPKQWREATSYEVVEIIFKNKSALAHLTGKVEDEMKQEEVKKLRKAVAYFLVRSYDMDPGKSQPPPLERVTDELNLTALGELVTEVKGEVGLENLSQSTRGFVTLGPRGAVIAYAKDFDHPKLRIAALNMIEILRGRHFNLIAARTFADDAIREVSDLCDVSAEMVTAETLKKKIADSLKLIMKANSLYGLVVSDPGTYLLDGSTLTRMARLAEDWFHLRSLREETERKMEALERLWRNFQDQRRIDVIQSLSTAFSTQPATKNGASNANTTNE